MGDYDKHIGRNIGIGGTIIAIIAVLANIGQIAEAIDNFFNKKKNNSDSTVIETTIPATENNNDFSNDYNVEYVPNEVIEEVTVTEPVETQPAVVYLSNLKATDSYGLHIEDSATDTIGNNYIGNVMSMYIHWYNGNYDCYAIYYLGGKYKTLSGTIAVSDSTGSEDSGQLFISSDDTVIYTTDEMSRVSVPIEFSVNVENCQCLELTK